MTTYKDYEITSDFFVQTRPDIHVPCIRAEYPDGTFVQLSHNPTIAFPLPFFTVLMNDDEQAYALRRKLLADNGYERTGKWYESIDGKWYEIWANFQYVKEHRLLGHHKASYYVGTCGTRLYVDNRTVFALDYDGGIVLRETLSRHDRACLRTYCESYGNDMTYDLLMSLRKKGQLIFNIIDILCDKGEQK